MLEEAIPVAQQERKKYMADVAFFYSTIFKEKIKHFIGLQLEELAQVGRSERMDDMIRANINCFRLIDDWMKEKTSEHIGNLTEIRNSLDQDKDFINKIKEDYEN